MQNTIVLITGTSGLLYMASSRYVTGIKLTINCGIQAGGEANTAQQYYSMAYE